MANLKSLISSVPDTRTLASISFCWSSCFAMLTRLCFHRFGNGWRAQESPIAAILIPAAFFLSVASPTAKEPNGLMNLAYIGAAFLAAAVLTLGVGLIRIPMKMPDQIIVGGKLKDGTLISAHYRGGLSRATNFRWETNGTRGDLVVSSSLGYPAVGEIKIQAGQDDDTTVNDLTIPAKYFRENAPTGPAQAVFYNYARLARRFEKEIRREWITDGPLGDTYGARSRQRDRRPTQQSLG